VNARAVAAWTAACVFIALFTTNPDYRAAVLVAAVASLTTAVGLRRLRGLLVVAALITALAVALNVASAHLGTTVLFSLPMQIPGFGGPYTLEAIAAGFAGGLTVAAAILAAAPFSVMLASHEVMDALPASVSRTGAAIAASLNLVPSVTASFAQVGEAQRLRGWRPRGPRSWAEVVVPVVLTSVEGSLQLAESMEARAFGSGPRTALRPASLGLRDWVLIGTSAAAVALLAGAQAAGWSAAWYAYPTLSWPVVDPLSLVACLLLFTPVVTWRSRA
jgi:energy-coupling factor transport system permease protein